MADVEGTEEVDSREENKSSTTSLDEIVSENSEVSKALEG